MLIARHCLSHIFGFKAACEALIELIVRLSDPQDNLICQRRLSLNLDQLTQRIFEPIVAPVDSLNLKIEAHVSCVFSFGSNQKFNLIEGFPRFYVNCGETFTWNDKLICFLEEIVVSFVM